MKLLYLHTDIFNDKTLFEKGMSLITAERRDKINQYKNEQIAKLSLGAGVLLRIAMDENHLSEKKILFGKYGKPYLETEGFHFSLSHSGEYAVCVYDSDPVGVDIQKVKEEIPRHTDKILSAKEKNDFMYLDESQRRDAFYSIWSAKESVIKLDGRGLRIPLNEIQVYHDGSLNAEIIFEDKMLYVYPVDFLKPEYAMSICTMKLTNLEEICNIDKNFLTKY